MVRRFGRPTWHIIAAAVAALAIAMPAAAQSTGMVKGVVRDDKGQPVEGAVVTIESVANARRFQTKTNRRGEYIQIGLNSGQYKVTAEKDKKSSDGGDKATNEKSSSEKSDKGVKSETGEKKDSGASKSSEGGESKGKAKKSKGD